MRCCNCHFWFSEESKKEGQCRHNSPPWYITKFNDYCGSWGDAVGLFEEYFKRSNGNLFDKNYKFENFLEEKYGDILAKT